jgi:hypothetical protein
MLSAFDITTGVTAVLYESVPLLVRSSVVLLQRASVVLEAHIDSACALHSRIL